MYYARIVRIKRIEDLLPRRLKAARALAGLSVDDLAAATGYSTHKLWRFERGDQIPDAVELAALAKATGQEIAYFLAEEAAA